MNNWDCKIDKKLFWCLAGVVLKQFYSEKEESKKQKEVQDFYACFG